MIMGTGGGLPAPVVATVSLMLAIVPLTGSLTGLAGVQGGQAADGHDHVHATPTQGVDTADLLGMLDSAVPQVAEGFVLTPLAPLQVPTSISFGPGDGDGPDLYATTFGGTVERVHLTWTEVGPRATEVTTVADGFDQPLGVAFDDAGNMYVSDRAPNEGGTGQLDGRVTMFDAPIPGSTVTEADGTAIVKGLPNGQHNTNHLRFGPDGKLYLPTGNPNDSGCENGPNHPPCSGTVTMNPDVFPVSGAILAVDPTEVADDPAQLTWVENSDGDGQIESSDGEAKIPNTEIYHHDANTAFRQKIDIHAHGFRNIFGVAFAPAGQGLGYEGAAYTAMNGADNFDDEPQPPSQDALYKTASPSQAADPGTNYTFPYCYPAGAPGATGDDAGVRPNPKFRGRSFSPTCEEAPTPTAMLGWHTCTTGLDFPVDADANVAGQPDFAFPQDLRSSVFIGECAFFFPDNRSVTDAGFLNLRNSPPTLSFDPTDPSEVASRVEEVITDAPRSTHSTSHKVVRVGLDEQDGEATEVRDFVTGLTLPTDVRFGPDGAMYIADAEGIFRVASAVAPPDAPSGPTTTHGYGPEPFVPVGTAGIQFAPQVVVVPEGTTVRWLYDGNPQSHTVTTSAEFCTGAAGAILLGDNGCEANDGNNDDGDPNTFNSGPVSGEPGGVFWEHAFTEPGLYEYYCTVHAAVAMSGAVVVTPGVS